MLVHYIVNAVKAIPEENKLEGKTALLHPAINRIRREKAMWPDTTKPYKNQKHQATVLEWSQKNNYQSGLHKSSPWVPMMF